MPAKRAEHHAKVQPRPRETRDVAAHHAQEVGRVRDELAEVPRVRHAAVLVAVAVRARARRRRDRSNGHGCESRAVDVGVEVASVLDANALDVRLDDSPELFLERPRAARVLAPPRVLICQPRGLVGDARVRLHVLFLERVSHVAVGIARVPLAVLEVEALLEAVDGLQLRIEGDAVAAGLLVERGLPSCASRGRVRRVQSEGGVSASRT